MDEIESEFSSKDCGHSLKETEKILEEVGEKKVFLEQATEVIQSQGRKLQGVLKSTRATFLSSGFTGGGSTQDLTTITATTSPTNTDRKGERREQDSRDVIRRAQSSEDLLDSPSLEGMGVARALTSSSTDISSMKTTKTNTLLMAGRARSEDRREDRLTRSCDLLGGGEDRITPPITPPSSPLAVNKSIHVSNTKPTSSNSVMVLCTPRRTRVGGIKSALSVPSFPVSLDHEVVREFLRDIDGRLSRLVFLWEGRKKELEEALRAMQFLEAVPQVIEWVETKGAEFLKKYVHYGRSIEEVRRPCPL